MTSLRKQQIHALLKSIETGDPASIAVINPDKYIQHNPQTNDGSEGLAALFKRISKSNPSVNIVRIFEDGDYVFAHTEYDFATSRIGFEVFRFENGQTVEHWDNIQPRQGPNPSGHSMVDGPTEVRDIELTESNRKLVGCFVEDVLIKQQYEKLEAYINQQSFIQHNPWMTDDLSELRLALKGTSETGARIKYIKMHRILAQGNFVLAVNEGSLDGVHCSFYELFRLCEGKIVDHWDTIEAIPSKALWKNNNGKF